LWFASCKRDLAEIARRPESPVSPHSRVGSSPPLSSPVGGNGNGDVDVDVDGDVDNDGNGNGHGNRSRTRTRTRSQRHAA
jgi:hypothetical protein